MPHTRAARWTRRCEGPARHAGLEGGCRDSEQYRTLRAWQGRALATIGLWAIAVSTQEAPPPVSAFEEFYRSAYRPLLRDVIFAGGKLHEAEDAVSAAMADVLQKWGTIQNPPGYARRAAIRNLIKEKQRGQQRLRERLRQRGDVPREHDLDPGLTAWEQTEWVRRLLESLPSAQREILACIIDEFTTREIAQLLGKTEAAVRQNLCAARKNLASCLAQTGRKEAR